MKKNEKKALSPTTIFFVAVIIFAGIAAALIISASGFASFFMFESVDDLSSRNEADMVPIILVLDSVEIENSSAIVTFTRGNDEGVLSGVKITFKNATSSQDYIINNSKKMQTKIVRISLQLMNVDSVFIYAIVEINSKNVTTNFKSKISGDEIIFR